MQRLYGVVVKVVPNKVVIGKPIFKTEQKEEYFGYIYDEDGQRIGIEEVDITKYGKPRFLPLSRKMIGDGEEYLIIWQPKKCVQQIPECRSVVVASIGINLPGSWLKFRIEVAVCNNQHFMICEGKTEQQMQQIYSRV